MNDITLSAIAWASLSTPLGIAAGIGWMRENRLLRIARDRSAYLDRTLMHRTEERDQAKAALVHAQDAASYYARLAVDAEDQLRKIEQTRHNAAKTARAAQIAQQRAAKEARRLELEQNIADRARKPRLAA